MSDYLTTQDAARILARPVKGNWRGVLICTQADADELIPPLLAQVADVPYVVVEPRMEIALTAISDGGELGASYNALRGGMTGCDMGGPRLGLVIVQGNTHPIHPDWVRRLWRDCGIACVPFNFLGWGEWVPKSQTTQQCAEWGTVSIGGSYWPDTTPWNGHDDDGYGEALVYRVGRARSGRLLDGREHDEMPEVDHA